MIKRYWDKKREYNLTLNFNGSELVDLKYLSLRDVFLCIGGIREMGQILLHQYKSGPNL